MHRSGATLGVALFGATFAVAGPGPWFSRQILDRIQITGYRYLGFHSHDVSGDRETFNSLTYYGQGNRRFTDTGQVTILGKDVLGALNFQATLLDSRFQDPQNQRFSVNVSRGGWSFDAGDIQGSLLNTNMFASFSKSLKGASVQYKQGRFAAKVLRSDTKAAARTISLLGINSAGPYYLSSSQVIHGSESVTVDGQQMVLGQDYVITYEIGAITFLNRVIPPTSTILVTYEALDFNGAAGTVQGVGLSYNLGKLGEIGVTRIEQLSRGSGGLSSRVEQFEGFGAAGTPYFLQFEPLSTPKYPTIVRVNGVRQTEGVDYNFDAVNKSIFYFTRFIPATSIVEVSYFPRPTSVANGDRRVTGIDYRIPLGNSQSYLKFSQATGELRNDASPLKGTARGIGGVYKTGPWEFKGGWRDIPDTFVGIESRGFLRNEKAVDFGLEYSKGGFKYGASHANAAIATRTVDLNGNSAVNRGRQTTSKLFAGYTSQGWTWNAEHMRRNVSSSKGDTRLDTTTYSASKAYGKLDARFGVDHQTGSAPDSNGATSRLGLDSVRMDLDYRPTADLSLGLRSSLSRVSFGGQNGAGRDLGLSATYRPNDKWLFDFGASDSDSGQLATLAGFQGSLGYEGNGFSSGAIGTAFSAGSTRLQLLNFHGRYESGSRTNFDARVTKSRSSGSLYTNTDTTFMGLGIDYDLGAGHNISLSVQQNDTRFLDSPNRSVTRSLDFGFGGRPKGPWSYRLGANLDLGGGGQFSQDSISIDGSLGYRIDDRQQVYAIFSAGRTAGYLPQEDRFFGIFYEYRLFQNVGLIASYKFRSLSNQDPLFTSGAYRSRGFDLELSFSFGR